MVGSTGLTFNSTNVLNRDKTITGDYRNLRKCVLEVNTEDLGWQSTPCCWSWPVGWDIRIELATEKESIDFEMGDWGTSAHLHRGLENISCRSHYGKSKNFNNQWIKLQAKRAFKSFFFHQKTANRHFKSFIRFKEKGETTGQGIVNFSFKMLKIKYLNSWKYLKNNMKLTKASCWIGSEN